MAEPLLALRGVRSGYGDAVVLDDVSLELPEHGSLAVLGRNGVGKTTLLLTVLGYTRLQRGKIFRSEEHTLNSSHDQISYAVFCLKKKKSQNVQPKRCPSTRHRGSGA